MTGMSGATAWMASTSAGSPNTWVTMMALVLGVSAARTVSGVTFHVPGSASATTGLACR